MRLSFRQGVVSHQITSGQGFLSLVGVPATLLTDGYTPPAAGQVNWLSGRGSLWFNSADANKSISGSWITALKVNFT